MAAAAWPSGVIEALRALVGAEVAAHCQLAHRLDRETSGCLAVAKNRRTLLELHGEFRAGQVGKRYDAIVAGRWPRGARRVEMPLARVLTTGGERRVRVRADGEPARTDFTVERWLGDGAATWLAVYPKTGRTHQIRVHAMASGHPIIGDEKYAGPDIAKKFGHPRLLLHASELAVRLRGHRHRFRAPPPARLQNLPRTLGTRRLTVFIHSAMRIRQAGPRPSKRSSSPSLMRGRPMAALGSCVSTAASSSGPQALELDSPGAIERPVALHIAPRARDRESAKPRRGHVEMRASAHGVASHNGHARKELDPPAGERHQLPHGAFLRGRACQAHAPSRLAS